LQALLEERGATKRNWLERWWLEYGYLRGRYPIAVNVNFYAVFLDHLTPPGTPPCAIAAEFIARVCRYRLELMADQRQVEFMNRGKVGDVAVVLRESAKQIVTRNVPL
jgi:hypothetical protein